MNLRDMDIVYVVKDSAYNDELKYSLPFGDTTKANRFLTGLLVFSFFNYSYIVF